ncbi:glycosyltransferase [Aquirufa sp. HETE-40SA]
MSEILLSICIPTRNRSNFLNKTLNSIVIQKIFIETNEIEIVISDNASEDETELVCMKFIESFPQKIRYYKNKIDLVDKNFEKVLSYGNGTFLKLNNDTLTHNYNSLRILLNYIKDFNNKDNILFFSNNYSKIKEREINSINDFIKYTYYSGTWIGSFGIWKSDFSKLSDFSRSSHLKLIQFDVLLRLIDLKKNIIVINECIFKTIPVPSKGGYDLIEVFLKNILYIINKNDLEHTVKYVVKLNLIYKIVNKFLFIWYCRMILNENFTFQFNNIHSSLYRHTKHYRIVLFVFYAKLILFIPALTIYKFIITIYNSIDKANFK